MGLVRGVIAGCALLTIFTVAQAQGDTKHFAKDGLSFDYATGWDISDKSNSDAQDLMATHSGSDAQIRFFVHRGRVDTPEKLAQAKKSFIDPYIKATANQFEQMGAKPEKTDATTEIGGAKADGVRVRASLSGEGGEAAIYWVVLGNRVVVLTLFGPDKDLKRAAPTWDLVRNSLKVEASGKQSGAKPSATPKP